MKEIYEVFCPESLPLSYSTSQTELFFVDPYNDFLSEEASAAQKPSGLVVCAQTFKTMK